MSFSLLRNQGPGPLTLPSPLKGIVESGGARVLPYSVPVLIAMLGGEVALGGAVSVSSLPDNYAGSVDSFNTAIAVADLGGQVVTTIVDSDNGSDDTGVGSDARPYRTIPRGLTSFATFFDRGTQRILCRGTALHKLPDGYILPYFVGGAPAIFPGDTVGFSAKGFKHVAPLIIEAEPIDEFILLAADYTVVSASNNVTTLNYTPGGLTPDEFKGGWFTNVINPFEGFFVPSYPITKNTANQIEINTSDAISGDLAFHRQGATIQAETGAGFGQATIGLVNNPTLLGLNGVKVIGNAGNANAAIEVSKATVQPQCCYLIDGLSISVFYGSAGVVAGFGAMEINSCVISGGYLYGFGFATYSIFESLVEEMTFFIVGEKTELSARGQFDSCINLGSDPDFGGAGVLSLSGLISNSPDNGVRFQGPGACSLRGVFVKDPVVDGVVILGGNAEIGDALYSVGGSGIPGVGLRIKDGAQVKASALASIPGVGGDIKVGTLAPVSWATFRTGVAPYNRVDLTPLTADLSRLHQDV